MSATAINPTIRTGPATSDRRVRLMGVTTSLNHPGTAFRTVWAQPSRMWQLVSYERRLALMNLLAVVVAVLVISALTALFFGRGLEMVTTQAADVIDQSGVSAATVPANDTTTVVEPVTGDAPWDPYAPAIPAAIVAE